MKYKIDLEGQKYGRLVVGKFSHENKHKEKHWHVICDCGVKKTVASESLKKGHTKSCGCLRRESSFQRKTKHSMFGTPVYRTWHNMKKRCMDKNHLGFKYYGGRGIKVCSRWMDFGVFYNDMGDRPSGLTLDRIDNNGDYEPINCRWATKAQQANNRNDYTLMSKKRYAQLMDNRSSLYGIEIEKGWHFCPEWDFLLVGPKMKEFECCLCLE